MWKFKNGNLIFNDVTSSADFGSFKNFRSLGLEFHLNADSTFDMLTRHILITLTGRHEQDQHE